MGLRMAIWHKRTCAMLCNYASVVYSPVSTEWCGLVRYTILGISIIKGAHTTGPLCCWSIGEWYGYGSATGVTQYSPLIGDMYYVLVVLQSLLSYCYEMTLGIWAKLHLPSEGMNLKVTAAHCYWTTAQNPKKIMPKQADDNGKSNRITPQFVAVKKPQQMSPYTVRLASLLLLRTQVKLCCCSSCGSQRTTTSNCRWKKKQINSVACGNIFKHGCCN